MQLLKKTFERLTLAQRFDSKLERVSLHEDTCALDASNSQSAICCTQQPSFKIQQHNILCPPPPAIDAASRGDP